MCSSQKVLVLDRDYLGFCVGALNEIDLILDWASKLTWFQYFTFVFNWDTEIDVFHMGIEIHFFFCAGGEIDCDFVCGPIIIRFSCMGRK